MKLFALAAVLCSTFVVSLGAENRTSEQAPVRSKEEEATKYCNSSYPVTEDPRQKLNKMVINGETILRANQFHDTEWCHLNCFLEKVGFFDAEGGIQVRRILKYVFRTLPELKASSPYLMTYLFRIRQITKNMEDKCAKACIAYYKFTEAVIVATLAVDLDANGDAKEKVLEAVLSKDGLPKELGSNVEKYFKNVELFFKKTAENSENITSTVAPVPAT